MEKITMTHAEWEDEAIRRFGPDKNNWKFKCPACGHVASAREYIAVGGAGAVGFSCIGRYKKGTQGEFMANKKAPCNYAGGGLFQLNPLLVQFEDGSETQAFEFAEADYVRIRGEP